MEPSLTRDQNYKTRKSFLRIWREIDPDSIEIPELPHGVREFIPNGGARVFGGGAVGQGQVLQNDGVWRVLGQNPNVGNVAIPVDNWNPPPVPVQQEFFAEANDADLDNLVNAWALAAPGPDAEANVPVLGEAGNG